MKKIITRLLKVYQYTSIGKSTGGTPWNNPKAFFSICPELDLGIVKEKGINIECWKYSTGSTLWNIFYGFVRITNGTDSAFHVNCFGGYQILPGVD
jgi:hypothetical protein